MMDVKRYVISRDNLPKKIPIMGTAFWLLAIDYWGAPEWLRGVVYCLLALVWIVVAYEFFKYDDIKIDLFNQLEDPNVKTKTWSERLSEVQAAKKSNQSNINQP